MEFRILGPLEAIEDGCGLDLGALKQRALIAVLLLEANRVVPTDRLIDALWEDEPPETAQKALQVYVSQAPLRSISTRSLCVIPQARKSTRSARSVSHGRLLRQPPRAAGTSAAAPAMKSRSRSTGTTSRSDF
jgi:DNA-binding SARP family transcriptional activator